MYKILSVPSKSLCLPQSCGSFIVKSHCPSKVRAKEENEKNILKLSIQKTKIIAFGSITSWQIGGEKGETVKDFIFLSSKITADGDCSHKIKRCLLL